ncbi:hypothetical protein QBC32DRAFT_370043 [Pseudoneurospora amorphoporcata]|uniref:C2H2-type domain-containing protein n=1 Tax=Pseudoneurospora amorphoporcata TaxID=241081 RepID=A0AAN6SGF5_9PEZI|nr:hypothetical protein QBC32DRAFT_370043 [Pseudoneurospora amorphoporcata]
MESIPKGEKLIGTIASADESTLRAVLRGLCADREVQELVGKHLYEQRPPVHICIQCGHAFEEDDNKKECRYHTEEMEIDDNASTWYDWDENRHGEMDSEKNRRNPDTLGGFIYPCCDKRADEAEGCKMGYHRAVDGKRGRFDVDDSVDEEKGGEDEEQDNEEEEDDE